MNKINTIIVDDELEAREGIKLLLEEQEDINVVGLCKNGIEAIDMINEHHIDLVFLDIQMPQVNGFEVVRSINKTPMPLIVFVTAYDQFAIKAFEVNAVDYLLKPFSNARFEEALTRARKLIEQQRNEEAKAKLDQVARQALQRSGMEDLQLIDGDNSGNNRLVIKEKGSVKFIPLSTILWLEAYDYYVKIHVNDKFFLVRDSLKRMASQLPEERFLRIHKSFVINLDHLTEISSGPGGEYSAILKNGISLKVSRSYKEEVKKRLT